MRGVCERPPTTRCLATPRRRRAPSRPRMRCASPQAWVCSPRRPSGRSAADCDRAFGLSVPGPAVGLRRTDELAEHRMRARGTRSQLWMELARDEEGVIVKLDDLRETA